ncbi:MFS transporter [Actinomadura sp. LOL_016]|uniref:MFS transporter n=1 Tax=unclassified Actinomadura TaxID=2626254 RepID=UPI003A80EF88
MNGFVLATWFARIPAVAEGAGLGERELGIALLGVALGALLAFQVSAWMSARRGSAVSTAFFGFVFCASLLPPAFTTSMTTLFAALLLLGAGNGGMDVAMNAQGLRLERSTGRPALSSLHGFFSLGGLAGAALGGLAAGGEVPPAAHFAAVALAAAAALLWARPRLLADHGSRAGGAVRPPPRALWGIGAIAFCAAVGEGAMADWSALYFRDTLEAPAWIAPLGYAAFSVAMLAGRFAGDVLRDRVPAPHLVTAGAALAAAGLTAGVAVAHPVAAIAGFGVVGLGLSIIAPITFEAATRRTSLPPSQALSAVATMGYAGFLAGPPLLGLVASASSLRLALLLVAALCVVAATLSQRSSALKSPRRTE